jgi:hypothetical protein
MKGARIWLGLSLAAAMTIAFAGCGSDSGPAPVGSGDPVCGNNVCEAGESVVDCSADCASCAGGQCGTCGNNVIEAGENCDTTAFLKGCKEFLFEAGGVSCNPDCTLNTSGCCNDACPTEGATQCNGNVIESCNMTAAGCRLWVPITNCEDLGQGCNAANGTAGCNGCVNACDTEGETHCNGTEIETCTKGVDGCNIWSATQDCSKTGQSCDATGGAATCTGTCISQCNLQGDKQCSGNDLQSCTDNGSGCLYWSTTEMCAAAGGSCDATAKACVSGCSNQCAKDGLQTCIGSVVNTCTKDVNGCLVFSPGEDCSAKGSEWLCKLTGAQTAACQPTCANPCTTTGEKRCQFNTVQSCNLLGNTCKEWQTVTTCPTGQTCSATSGTPGCVTAPITGEDCGTAWAVKAGANTVNWTATLADHLTSNPTCGSSTLIGPDVVLRYDPTFTGSIDVSINKPVSTRWTLVASDQTCGTLTPSLACLSEFTLDKMNITANVVPGKPVYIYLRDTNSGTATLSDPLIVNITELNCAVFAAKATPVAPAPGSTTTTLSPNVEIDFDAAVTPNKGTVTIKGATTNLSYNLATNPAEVTWSNANKKLVIATAGLKPNDTVTVSWTGLEDATCSKAVPAPSPAWTFKVVNPPCSPGAGGMVGTTVTRYATGATTVPSEYYVEADNNPTGWVYIGNYYQLYRTKKTGGAWEDIYSAAALSSTSTGYGMLIDGNNIYTLDDITSGNKGHIWRISSNGGSNFAVQDYANFPGSPTDDTRSAFSYKGQIYMLTQESTSTQDTEIWRAPATGTPPVNAAFERAVPGQLYCSGIGVDDSYFYLACSTGNRLLKVARSNGAVSLITDLWPLSTTTNGMATRDTNNDGKADFIYYKGSTGSIYFACNPGGAAYSDKLVTYGTGTSDYGLGYSAAANALYTFDGITKELVVIK